MSPPLVLSAIDIPGADSLFFSSSLQPPQISGQSLSKLLGSNTGHGLENPTYRGTPQSSRSGVVSATHGSLKRAHGVIDHESPGQAETVASPTVGPKTDLALAKEETAGVASESDSDEEVEEASATHKKISDRRRAQNAKFKSWYLGSIHTVVRKLLTLYVGYLIVRRRSLRKTSRQLSKTAMMMPYPHAISSPSKILRLSLLTPESIRWNCSKKRRKRTS